MKTRHMFSFASEVGANGMCTGMGMFFATTTTTSKASIWYWERAPIWLGNGRAPTWFGHADREGVSYNENTGSHMGAHVCLYSAQAQVT